MLLRESLEEIDDFRVKRCRKFELADIFLLVLFGLLSGIKDIEHIAEWAEEAEESIKGLVRFEFGPPSADTILRVFRNVNADKIEKVFIKRAHGIYEKVKIEPDRTIVAIDGKTMSGSNKVTGAKGIHIVSAWADELSLILGQVKTDEKSNEITAIPELLELIDIRGMIITIDAMGCQKKICGKIKEKKADYVLSLKGNQSTTHEAVKDFFSMDEKELAKYGVIKSEKECNPDHGRIENRQYYLCTNLSWLENKDEWPGLKAVAMDVVPGKNSYEFDVSGLMSKARAVSPRIIIITTPHNPTGTVISASDLETIIKENPSSLVIVDEAYLGFSEQKFDVRHLLAAYSNVVFSRTFSKLYGLAGISVGYGLCAPMAKQVFRLDVNPFRVNNISRKMAVAALRDEKYYKGLLKDITESRNFFINEMNSIPGVKAFDSAANFVFIHFSENTDVQALKDYLAQNGYLVRLWTEGSRLAMRVTLDRKETMEKVVALMKEFLEK